MLPYRRIFKDRVSLDQDGQPLWEPMELIHSRIHLSTFTINEVQKDSDKYKINRKK